MVVVEGSAAVVRDVQRADRCRWALAGCWLLLLLVALVIGERDTSLSRLEAALDAGRLVARRPARGRR